MAIPVEFAGIESRLDELDRRLARLRPLREKPRDEFDRDPNLRDVVERNLQVAAQCCLDISHRIGSREGSRRIVDDIKSIQMFGRAGRASRLVRAPVGPVGDDRKSLAREFLRSGLGKGSMRSFGPSTIWSNSAST